MDNTRKQANKLIHEKSPYLLQHAYNPVNWYPWNEEAFAKARFENKPIFLSIGYSTCHWCHVMERESFEDDEVAALLNKFFVSIKVDREERPDVDHLYMQFCQALTGSGGWPLTILMTPEKQPFFAGTYFPKTDRYGRSGLLKILNEVGTAWQNDDQPLRESAYEIVNAVKSHHQGTEMLPLQTHIKNDKVTEWVQSQINKAYDHFVQTFDQTYGGFGRPPKFPSPHNLTFLLRYAHDYPESKALHMVEKTLSYMAKGGIYDHIGYGFARYSTDRKWLVPHFEKMLYDNALLAIAYLEFYQLTKKPYFAHIASRIFDYVLRDMTSNEGVFYSAEDADSEGVEGKFYVWTPEEIKTILEPRLFEMYRRVYDISQKGNFEGKNIPNLIDKDWEQLAAEFELSTEELTLHLEEARQKLFHQREKRIHPHKDDKILTSWNALMIAALAKGAQILGNNSYLDTGVKATEFILSKMRQSNGRLLARYREGESAYLAYLDDYAFLIWALLEIYTASGKAQYLQLALELQKDQDNLFADHAGGYFLTGSDAEELLFRPKDVYDGALPSGNSITALNLLRLSRLTADPEWEEKSSKQILAFRETLEQYPSGYGSFLQALQFSIAPGQEVILAGPLNDESITNMQKELFKNFHPYATLLYQEGTLAKWIPWVKDYSLINNEVTAYVCQNFACQKPLTDPKQLHKLLN